MTVQVNSRMSVRSVRQPTARYDHTKMTGSHYTPPLLAKFLAKRALEFVDRKPALSVFDPSCGDGELLVAVADLAKQRSISHVSLHGLDKNPAAVATARTRLEAFRDSRVDVTEGDFLDDACRIVGPQQRLFETQCSPRLQSFDLIIANPPYVRTQVLGSRVSQQLATRLGLSGRVDLYHAFVRSMTASLANGGTLALLCSNRFLSTLSGAAVREHLSTEYTVEEIFDLGDTKLFGAAVLPAIVIARRHCRARGVQARFVQIYEERGESAGATVTFPSVLDALESSAEGRIRSGDLTFRIDRGFLEHTKDPKESWHPASLASQEWLSTLRQHVVRTFEDVGRVRVGIKTTADSVFIRDDWETLPVEMRPEDQLLRPLLTHKNARRWLVSDVDPRIRVLYPHTTAHGKPAPVILEAYPRTQSYFLSHEKRLRARAYVRRAGRKWYEIWVAHHPRQWSEPKIVFPDISESARFFLDESGAVVNGDCYWITLRPGEDQRWLMLMLAIANSSLAARFYDLVCGNRLYAGRRRFITQYVKKFPLPDPDLPCGRRILEIVEGLVAAGQSRGGVVSPLENALDEVVWESFGFLEKCRR